MSEKTEVKEIGNNVKISVQGDKLIININLKKKRVESKSGKSMIIASTKGNRSVEYGKETLKLGLNLYAAI